MIKTLAIVDYGLGNIYSVNRAAAAVGFHCRVTSDTETIENSDALVLPGVGAFGDAMNRLRELKLINVINRYVKSGRPLLGVCLGMQLLCTESEEFGVHKGLDIVKAKVTRFSDGCMHQKVPQIQWNKVFTGKDGVLFEGIHDESFMYFLHSYYVKPETKLDVEHLTEYAGIRYCSAFEHGNIFATQFHPEKSGELGLAILKNFYQRA